MPRNEIWADNFVQQVEEAVALRAILSEDFRFTSPDSFPSDPEDLYNELDSLKEEGLPDGLLTFVVFVNLKLPETGLEIQVGENVPTGHNVRFLPPLSVQLTLPHDYPSASPPVISLEAPWLSRQQVAQLLDRLLAEAEAETNSPVCYTLVSWLESSALEHLGVGGALVIQEDSDRDAERLATSSGASTSRAVPTAESRRPEQVIEMLVRFNASQEHRVFQEGTWTCKVCFEEVPGIRCIRAAICPHYFCASCLQAHCKIQLKENRVDLLLCPEPHCKEPLIRDRVASLLDPEEVRRWEESELQTTLMKMGDVVFCPRCNAPSIEDSDNSALCSKCHFSFCSLCQSAYHPGQRCMSAETKLRMLKERMSGRKGGALLKELRRKEEELLSLASIEKTSKPCPVCSAAISRTEGCNKMACIVCGAFFCYICGKSISGYGHFRADGCVLFDEEEVRRWNEQFDRPEDMEWQPRREVPELRMQQGMRRCPTCGAFNPKVGNLNMLACRGCRAHYCFLCGKALRKGEAATHFRPSGCKMHSAD